MIVFKYSYCSGIFVAVSFLLLVWLFSNIVTVVVFCSGFLFTVVAVVFKHIVSAILLSLLLLGLASVVFRVVAIGVVCCYYCK